LEKIQELKYLKKLGEGDREAFNLLFLHYYPKLKNFLKAMLKDEDEAKDIAQNIFVKVWIKRKTISGVSFFSAYLFNMAKNAIYDFYDHNLIKENYVKKEQFSPIDEDIIENTLYANELEKLLNITVAAMPKRRREIFLMSRQQGMSNQDIALKLKLNKRTVENQLTTALAKLREVISTFKILLF
jgi:RNA polymerase sigma-70 factor (ECF subfamily)